MNLNCPPELPNSVKKDALGRYGCIEVSLAFIEMAHIDLCELFQLAKFEPIYYQRLYDRAARVYFGQSDRFEPGASKYWPAYKITRNDDDGKTSIERIEGHSFDGIS